MLLFQKRFHEGLTSGAVRLTFRRWQKPHVRVGGRYRCHPIGVLEVDAVACVRFGDVSAADAQRAGFGSLAELTGFLAELGPLDEDTVVWRVELHHGGDGDRVEIALDAELGPGDIEAIAKKLERLDRDEPWTLKTLRLIAKKPQVAASKLAVTLKRDRDELKIDIRKLKRLGLTQSFEVGYELSPRGRAYLEARGRKRRRS
jgi:hypothetical protein